MSGETGSSPLRFTIEAYEQLELALAKALEENKLANDLIRAHANDFITLEQTQRQLAKAERELKEANRKLAFLFDGYAVYNKLKKMKPNSSVAQKPNRVSDVLDAIVALQKEEAK